MSINIQNVFADYSKSLQAIVDTRLDKFKTPFYNRFFQLGMPTPNLTYQSIIGTSRIEAAASIVAHGSEAPLRGRAGLSTLAGKVSSIKVKRKMDEDQYRNMLMLESIRTPDESKKTAVLKLIWNDVEYVVNAVQQRLDLMAARALSTGVVPIDTTSNPDGVIPGDIDLLVTHKVAHDDIGSTTGSTRTWTAANKGTANPIADIIKVTRDYWNTYGIVFDKILMTPEKLWIVLSTTEVVNALKGFTNVDPSNGYFPSMSALNALLLSQNLPVIETVDVRGAIEKDGVLTSYNGWSDKKYVTFVPAGQLGVMHNSYALEEMNPVANVDYAIANRTLVSRWSQTEPFGEYTRGEIAAFPGLEMADQLVLVNTEHQTIF